VESVTPGHDGYPLAFVPINWTVSKETISDTRFRKRGIDLLPSLSSASKPRKNSFPKPGFYTSLPRTLQPERSGADHPINWPTCNSSENPHSDNVCLIRTHTRLSGVFCAAFITAFFMRFSPAQYKLISCPSGSFTYACRQPQGIMRGNLVM
jgi:hypothetical protein